MNVSLKTTAEQVIIYEMDDVLIAAFPENNEVSLVFRTETVGLVQKYLPSGGPKHLNQIAAPSEAGVKFWHNHDLHAWIVVHKHQSPNNSATTIFLPDEGEPYIRNGLVASVVPHGAPSSFDSMLKIVGLTSLVLTLCRIV